MARHKPAADQRTAPLWSMPVPVADIPETGRRLDVTADAATRAVLAKAAGVNALPRLKVSAELSRHGHDGVRVAGQVAATVEQACVVSLDPLQSEIVESFDLLFVPAAEIEAVAVLASGEASDEPPEALRDGVVDIGSIAAEFLLLGIDPYPRKPGAQFDAPPAGDPAAHPFAALAALKKPS